ncbi:GNAT family N-acetyltransferase [Microbacterium sp. YY-02]|uniref:GNAT family N-acetyltransferase n=2 Tax=unclassified Microbacterium TaxID=2609290 RepID=UPI003D1846E2
MSEARRTIGSTERNRGSMLVLRKWRDDDHPVAMRSNSPEFMTYLGGPEAPEKVESRAAKYADGWRTGANAMFVLTSDDPLIDGGVTGDPRAVGVIGYWPVEEDGEPVLEAGWTIFVPGRGFATEGVRLVLRHAAAHSDRDSVHAYPRTDNEASNALCRRVGFELLGEVNMEYPPGNPIISRNWRYDLRQLRAALRE